jgi:hypothetical protein
MLLSEPLWEIAGASLVTAMDGAPSTTPLRPILYSHSTQALVDGMSVLFVCCPDVSDGSISYLLCACTGPRYAGWLNCWCCRVQHTRPSPHSGTVSAFVSVRSQPPSSRLLPPMLCVVLSVGCDGGAFVDRFQCVGHVRLGSGDVHQLGSHCRGSRLSWVGCHDFVTLHVCIAFLIPLLT